MKTIYFCNETLRTKYAGEIDSLVTDIFFSFIFGAYTFFIWEIAGGLFSSVTGLISLLCLSRVVYIFIEWLKDTMHSGKI